MSRSFNEVADLIQKVYQQTIQGDGDSDRHLLSLFSIALSLGAKNILELGVRDGATTLPLLLAAHVNEGHLISVDQEKTSFIPPSHLQASWTFHHQNSLHFLESYDKKKAFDLVYIDDWHAYSHVKKELEFLDPCVSPKSLILLHDLMYGGTEPQYHTDLSLQEGQWAEGGPYRAVAELPQNFWEFSTIPSCNGLTVLRKKYSSLYHS